MQRPKLISQRWPSVLQLSIFISQKLKVPESHSAMMYKHLTEHHTSLGWKLESHSKPCSSWPTLPHVWGWSWPMLPHAWELGNTGASHSSLRSQKSRTQLQKQLDYFLHPSAPALGESPCTQYWGAVIIPTSPRSVTLLQTLLPSHILKTRAVKSWAFRAWR